MQTIKKLKQRQAQLDNQRKESTNNWQVHQLDDFDFRGPEYSELLSACDTTAFQAPEWLAPFYGTFASSSGLEPVIVTLRDQSGQLQMVLPCVRHTVCRIKIVEPCDAGLSDYNCPIVHPDAVNAIQNDDVLQQQILDALAPCDVFFFRKQRAEKIGIESIISGGSTSLAEVKAHQVDLSAPYDAWALNTLSKNFRSNMRAKLRKLDKNCGQYWFETLTEPEEITNALRFIQRYRGQRFKNDILSNNSAFEFYRAIALQNVETGFAQTFVMSIGEEVIAAYFGLNWDDTHCYLLGAFKPGEFERYSVGLQTLNALVADRIDNNFQTFDFGLGDEPFKKRFNAEDVKIHNTVYPQTALGKVVALTYENAKPLKSFLVNNIFRF